MQTIYLGFIDIIKIEELYNRLKKYVMESKAIATESGAEVPNFECSSLVHQEAESTLLRAASEIRTAAVEIRAADMRSELRASAGSPLPQGLHNTQILDPVTVKRLRSVLPPRFRSSDWELLYSTALDGISINTYVLHPALEHLLIFAVFTQKYGIFRQHCSLWRT